MTSVSRREAPLFDEGKDYNHASDSQYKNYRQQASKFYDKKTRLSRQSQEAYKNGDKQRANELSEQSKQALQEAEHYNRKAAEYVFLENNSDSKSDEIDLHGLYVKEAKWILQRRITECIRTNQPYLKVIVGKGLHSQNGVAKLKPAVDEMCNESGLSHRIDSKNAGILVIDLSNNSTQNIPSHWDQSPVVVSQGPGQAHQQPHYQQQPNYQQQSQQSQPQQSSSGSSVVDMLLKFVCSFFK